MYLSVDDSTAELATLSDGKRIASYRRAGLSMNRPDARYRPGCTDVEPHLWNADNFPDEINIEFVHARQVYRFVPET
jgi:hypothetical protein